MEINERRKAVVLLARSGLHQAEIARRVGLTRERVRQILKSEGVKANRREARLAHVPDDELFAGAPRLVAERLGVPVSYIYAERRRRKVRHGV